MIIIGIHRGHGSSCAIMVNGVIKVASQEERFSGIKNDIGFPHKALKWCMNELNIEAKDVNKIIYTTTYFPAIFTKSKHRVSFSQEDYIKYYQFAGEKNSKKYFNFLKKLRDNKKYNQYDSYYDFSFLTNEVLKNSIKEKKLWTKEQINYLIREFLFTEKQIIFADHHTCHAYYGYFASNIRNKKTAILTLDGGGDGRNETLWIANKNKLSLISNSKTANLAKIYKLVTLIMGLRPDEDEHKVMGMAPYSDITKAKEVSSIYEKLVKVDGLNLIENQKVDNIFIYLKEKLDFIRFDNIAGSIQFFTEKILSELIKNICLILKVKNIIFCGGIALNIKANKVISEIPEIQNIFIPASPGDETLSLGACYWGNNGGKRLSNMYLGYENSKNQINTVLEKNKNKYKIINNIGIKNIAKLLSKGNIIARISGRAEFGARALGNRSILAHPGKIGIKDLINKSIKKRDFWMPFAITILQDKMKEIILNTKNNNGSFMTMAFDVKKKYYKIIFEGIHPYDYSTRPQILKRKDNSEYYDIINEFYKITGIPAILNTSFNLHRKPICNTVEDAIFILDNSDLKFLLVDKTLLEKL